MARRATELSLKAKPKRDRSRPFKFKVMGKLGGFIADRATCEGNVKLRARKGSKTVGKAKARVKLSQGDCSFRGNLKPSASGRLKVLARFDGNSNLAAATSKPARVRAG